MKTLAALGALTLGLLAVGAASRRIATHRSVLPGMRGRVNTRVIRINQR